MNEIEIQSLIRQTVQKEIDGFVDRLTITLKKEVEAEMEARNRLIPRKEVAARLGVNYSTLWRWQQMHFLDAVYVGRKVFYKEKDLKTIENSR